ncbi:unnamed protein product, partial [Ixodes pacificus]
LPPGPAGAPFCAPGLPAAAAAAGPRGTPRPPGRLPPPDDVPPATAVLRPGGSRRAAAQGRPHSPGHPAHGRRVPLVVVPPAGGPLSHGGVVPPGGRPQAAPPHRHGAGPEEERAPGGPLVPTAQCCHGHLVLPQQCRERCVVGAEPDGSVGAVPARGGGPGGRSAPAATQPLRRGALGERPRTLLPPATAAAGFGPGRVSPVPEWLPPGGQPPAGGRRPAVPSSSPGGRGGPPPGGPLVPPQADGGPHGPPPPPPPPGARPAAPPATAAAPPAAAPPPRGRKAALAGLGPPPDVMPLTTAHEQCGQRDCLRLPTAGGHTFIYI